MRGVWIEIQTLWISPSVLTAWLTTHTFYLHFHHPQCSIDSWESQYRTTLTSLSYFYMVRYLRGKKMSNFWRKSKVFEPDCGGPDCDVKDIVCGGLNCKSCDASNLCKQDTEFFHKFLNDHMAEQSGGKSGIRLDPQPERVSMLITSITQSHVDITTGNAASIATHRRAIVRGGKYFIRDADVSIKNTWGHSELPRLTPRFICLFASLPSSRIFSLAH